MSVKNIFRSKAFADTSPLDALDERIKLLSPKLWFALSGIFIFLVIAGVWSWFGRIDQKVSGAGMVTNLGGIRSVTAQANGTIMYLNVEEGYQIEQHQIIGVIEQPLIMLEIKDLIDKLIVLKNELVQIVEAEKKNKLLHNEYHKNIMKATDETIGKLTKIRNNLQEIALMYKNLQEKGITSKVSFYQTLQNFIMSEVNLTEQMTNKYKLPMEYFEFDFTKKMLFWDKMREIELTLNNLNMKKLEYSIKAILRSPVKGTVINIMKSSGDSVILGENIVTIVPEASKAVYLTAFVSVKDWKGIKRNQIAYVAPTNMEPQRHGYILGLVRDISHYPETDETINVALQNKDLVRFMKGDNDAVTRVTIEFIPDPENPTGFKWTCVPPEDTTVTVGTSCNVFIVVDRQPPISYVVPWIKEVFLGTGRNLPLDKERDPAK